MFACCVIIGKIRYQREPVYPLYNSETVLESSLKRLIQVCIIGGVVVREGKIDFLRDCQKMINYKKTDRKQAE